MPHAINLYNTATRAVEPFTPQNPNAVSLYVCGPTVYDKAHLGHARCYITWDVLYRTLQALGYGVTYARNVTDVDDKILKRAAERGETPEALALANLEGFHADMARLHTLPPDIEPRATQHIDGMQAMIHTLLEKGHAYTAEDGVYFATTSMPNYGRLSRKPPDALQAGARVEVNTGKRHPADFALWKFAPEAEYGWASPWGYGRPGWHIECSAMIASVFGEQIDLHAGGADLVFPHHENEIAQSECCSGKAPFVRHWLHNGFVNVDGEKMSKSLGNFSTVDDLLQHIDANALRYFLLSHHYRMPVDFTPDALSASAKRIGKMKQLLANAARAMDEETLKRLLILDAAPELKEDAPFTQALSQDMNTPRALAVWNGLFNGLNKHGDETVIKAIGEQAWVLGFDMAPFVEEALKAKASPAANASDEAHHVEVPAPSAQVREQVMSALGCDALPEEGQAFWLSILNLRREAKQAKDFARSDAIRDALEAQGFQLIDRPKGWMTLKPKA